MRVSHALLLTAVLSAASCVSGRDCVLAIPADLRADAIRYALDGRMTTHTAVPRDDLTLAFGAGNPYESLSAERKVKVALHATGYAQCIRERIDRK